MLAEHVVGRGHGLRTLFHQAAQGCLLHDASYWLAWELTGSRTQLLAVMQAIRYGSLWG